MFWCCCRQCKPGSEDPVIEEYVVGSGAAIVSVSRMVKTSMLMPRVQIASMFMSRAKAACCGESSEQGDGSKEGR